MKTSVPSFLLSIVLLSLLSNHLSSALFCFRCLRLDCKGANHECKDVRSFILFHLSDFYDVEKGYVLPCELDPEDLVEWRAKEAYEKPCENSPNTATCTAGRLQVKSYPPGGQIPVLISHATIIGCGKDQLIRRIQILNETQQCDRFKALGVGPFYYSLFFHMMTVQHCNTPQTFCRDKDFCVGPEESVVKEIDDVDATGAKWKFLLIVIVGGLVFSLIVAAIKVCLFPVNRASTNTTTTPPSNNQGAVNGIEIEDNADLTDVRTKSDDIGSGHRSGGNEIEEDLTKKA